MRAELIVTSLQLRNVFISSFSDVLRVKSSDVLKVRLLDMTFERLGHEEQSVGAVGGNALGCESVSEICRMEISSRGAGTAERVSRQVSESQIGSMGASHSSKHGSESELRSKAASQSSAR
jgi:hypothetical protein